MVSTAPKKRFPPPWRVERDGEDCFRVVDANGVGLASVYCRDDLQKWSFSHSHLSSDEARRIANAIARLPEFLLPRHGFYTRGDGHAGWKAERPYHVALEDSYLRAHWDEIDALCKHNGIPFHATGEQIQDGGLWRVYEFRWQMDAIQFWDRFEGRWLLGSEFHYPERPKDLPPMKPLKGWPKFDPKKARG
ncbi:hypothetical protein V1282_003526 [Nitrobacteraceae bacterium AZCC 2146]